MRRHEGLVAGYLKKLEQDIPALYADYPGPLKTIYFGGGTPSQLSNKELARIIGALAASWGWPASLETTLEADPKTFDKSRLETFRELGFTRLSIGLQSTQDKVLAFLGRQHSGSEGLRAVEMALEAGFEVSADLITAVPGQDTAKDLEQLVATGVKHLGVYNLTIEPYTPFARRGIRVDENKDVADYLLTSETLIKHGFVRYEVSNYAKAGHESQHNQVYWHGEYFLALGPSAADFVPVADAIGERRSNRMIKDWLKGAAPEVLKIGPREYIEDLLMTGLRTRHGVDIEAVKQKTGLDIFKLYHPLIKRYEEQGWLKPSNQFLRVSDAGLLKLNGILQGFFNARV